MTQANINLQIKGISYQLNGYGTIIRNIDSTITDEEGIYVVYKPDCKGLPRFCTPTGYNNIRFYDNKALEIKWNYPTDILYIGKAKCLSERLISYRKFGEKKNGHKGGRAIWQIDKDFYAPMDLTVQFFTLTEWNKKYPNLARKEAEEVEKFLLGEFAEWVCQRAKEQGEPEPKKPMQYPFANWRR